MQVNRTADKITVTLEGRVDYNTCDTIRKELVAFADEGLDMQVVLQDVPFMDSSGLGMLVSLRKKLESGGKRLVLASLNPEVEKVLRVTRLYQTFAVE